MFSIKRTKERFYIIVLFLMLLFCSGYAGLALFLNQLKSSSEAGQIPVNINNEIKELERKFWEVRFWERAVAAHSYPDAEKQFGENIEDIKKRLSLLNPTLFTEHLYEKTLQIFSLVIEYKSGFSHLMQVETDRKLNETKISSNYQLLVSAILMSNETDFLRIFRNLDRFLYTYLQYRRDSEYQAFDMVFKLLKGKLSKSEIMNDRLQSYVTELENAVSYDFRLEKERQIINLKFDEISNHLTHLFSDISQTAENLSHEAILTAENLRSRLQMWFLVSGAVAFIFLLFIINMLAKKIVNPIRGISHVVTQFQSGDDQARFSSESGDEIAELGFALNNMLDTINQHHYHLEGLVAERTRQLNRKNTDLNETLKAVEAANKKILESIQYAEKIQRSLLPNTGAVKEFLPDSFFIWMPKDIVGGDIFFADCFADGFIIAVIDSTGHGVPGAFMTMIASSALRRIIKDEGCHDPAEILNHLNLIVKTTLQQDTEEAASDDGMDVAICFVRKSMTEDNSPVYLIFSGAKLPLICVYNDELTVIKGDRQSIGYKQSRRSDINFEFTNHKIDIKKGMCFYMATDGFEDQLGDDTESRFEISRFGSKRFRELLRDNSVKPFKEQKEIILKIFHDYKGKEERQDDITVVGFSIEVGSRGE